MEQDKPKVLIVDDDEALCSLLSFRFSKRGFDVARAFNGQDALSYLKKAKFAVMLLDIAMPIIGGFALLKMLQAGDAPYPGTIIMLTADADETEVLEAFKLGAADYVTKPFNMEELLARVEAAIKYKSGLHQLANKQP